MKRMLRIKEKSLEIAKQLSDKDEDFIKAVLDELNSIFRLL